MIDRLVEILGITAESVTKVPSFDWLNQIVIKLPPNLPAGQELQVSISAHMQTSNKARLRIK